MSLASLCFSVASYAGCCWQCRTVDVCLVGTEASLSWVLGVGAKASRFPSLRLAFTLRAAVVPELLVAPYPITEGCGNLWGHSQQPHNFRTLGERLSGHCSVPRCLCLLVRRGFPARLIGSGSKVKAPFSFPGGKRRRHCPQYISEEMMNVVKKCLVPSKLKSECFLFIILNVIA